MGQDLIQIRQIYWNNATMLVVLEYILLALILVPFELLIVILVAKCFKRKKKNHNDQ